VTTLRLDFIDARTKIVECTASSILTTSDLTGVKSSVMVYPHSNISLKERSTKKVRWGTDNSEEDTEEEEAGEEEESQTIDNDKVFRSLPHLAAFGSIDDVAVRFTSLHSVSSAYHETVTAIRGLSQ
jgi:hypothetical protein